MKTKLLILSVCCLLAACDGPLSIIPGGALRGEEIPLILSSVPVDGGVIVLETKPDNPYSVHVGFVVIDKNMYIDPAEERTWYEYILADPRVRVRFEGSEQIHPAMAVAETDVSILDQFETDRHVLRIEPRQ
ncbi:MAG: hypothetical protein ACI809_001129 [Candidatus Azotimanducaceae bacterium]|jgi:hypothetical protein